MLAQTYCCYCPFVVETCALFLWLVKYDKLSLRNGKISSITAHLMLTDLLLLLFICCWNMSIISVTVEIRQIIAQKLRNILFQCSIEAHQYKFILCNGIHCNCDCWNMTYYRSVCVKYPLLLITVYNDYFEKLIIILHLLLEYRIYQTFLIYS